MKYLVYNNWSKATDKIKKVYVYQLYHKLSLQ